VDPPRDLTLVGHNVGGPGRPGLLRLRERGKPLPEAIFAFNDDMAIALMIWLRRRGIRVPEEVAVVGFDGINEAEYFGLTTVRNAHVRNGVLAPRSCSIRCPGASPRTSPPGVAPREPARPRQLRGEAETGAEEQLMARLRSSVVQTPETRGPPSPRGRENE